MSSVREETGWKINNDSIIKLFYLVGVGNAHAVKNQNNKKDSLCSLDSY